MQPVLDYVAKTFRDSLARDLRVMHVVIDNAIPAIRKLKEIFADLQFGMEKVDHLFSSVASTIGAPAGKNLGPLQNLIANPYAGVAAPCWKGAGGRNANSSGDDAGSGGDGKAGPTVNVQMTVDPHATASQIAEQVKRVLDEAHRAMVSGAQRQLVAHAAGGR